LGSDRKKPLAVNAIWLTPLRKDQPFSLQFSEDFQGAIRENRPVPGKAIHSLYLATAIFVKINIATLGQDMQSSLFWF